MMKHGYIGEINTRHFANKLYIKRKLDFDKKLSLSNFPLKNNKQKICEQRHKLSLIFI